jgi:hypothetical protein
MNPDFYARGYRPLNDDLYDTKIVTNWPETKLPKKSKRLRLSQGDLQYIAESIQAAREAGIGTFHLPTMGNRKVKFDKDTNTHYINF